MTCHDKEIAEQVVLYQELTDEERAIVDSHITQCNDCAETFWALDRSIRKLGKIGEKRRMALIHPTEDQIIQFAIDPGLLAPEQRARLQRHFERENCASCERIYWSVLESEKECARELEEKSRTHFLQMISPVWRKPVFAVALVLVVLQALEIREIVSMNRQIRSQQTAQNARPVNTNPATAMPQTQPAKTVGPQVAESSQPNQEQEKTIAGLRQQLQPYLKPRADAAYVLLLSTGRGGNTIPTAGLEGSKLFVVLQANLSKELGQYKKYKMVLQDSTGNVVKSDQVQVTQQDETLNYFVRKELLGPGLYTLQIYGLDSGQEHYLIQFPFRIVPAQ